MKRRFEDYLQEWGRRGCRQSAGASISGESRGWEFTVCEVADHEALGLFVLGHSLPAVAAVCDIISGGEWCRLPEWGLYVRIRVGK